MVIIRLIKANALNTIVINYIPRNRVIMRGVYFNPILIIEFEDIVNERIIITQNSEIKAGEPIIEAGVINKCIITGYI